MITCAPTDSQGRAAGSFSLKTLMTLPSIEILSVPAVILLGRLPRMESYLSRCARVFGSVRSLTATKSRFLSARAVRRTLRPMRPKPLMPTFIAIAPPKNNCGKNVGNLHELRWYQGGAGSVNVGACDLPETREPSTLLRGDLNIS